MTEQKAPGGKRPGSGRKVEPWSGEHKMIRCPVMFYDETRAFIKQLKTNYKAKPNG